MSSPTPRWADLSARMGAGAVMVLIGIIGIWLGGHIFHLLVAAICGIMVWELVGMLRPGVRHLQLQLGILAGVALLLATYLPVGLALPLLMVPAFVGFGQLTSNRTIYIAFTVMIVLAGFGMTQVRDELGFGWLLWLVLVVVVTDVVGYFAGRAFGGPKFWPKVSPKKTWSGTASGWVAAAVVGLLFSFNSGMGLQLVGISVALSMASQMGDMAESGMKRKMGVKDSSNLIPGHGGLMDRFDGMLGASLFLLLIGQFIGLSNGLG
ncbi:MAG: phosphatidate cytidylyltransferase [Sulfitobacter sp.]|nr:phosphatidate cytidylyltransferase [Sulfitobacter sp.]